MPNIIKHQAIAKKIYQQLPPDKEDIFFTLMTLDSEAILVDQETPNYLLSLKQKKVPTIALTANLTGKLKHIPSLEERKVNQLKQLGINFASSAPTNTHHIFHNLPSFRGYYSLHIEGVLFANGDVCPKGDVLVRYLQWANLHPKQVIFIDDRIHNLKNVEKALHDFDPSIEFEGIHYLGAHHVPSPEVSPEAFEAKWQTIVQEALEF